MGYKQVVHVNTQVKGGTANTDTITITKPVGLQVNDLMLAFFLIDLSGISTPSGWTQYDDDSSTNMENAVWYKFATSSDVAASSFTFTAGDNLGPFCGGISAYRNVDTSSPFNTGNQTVTNASTNPVSTPTAAISQTSLPIYYMAARIGSTTIPTFTSSGVTERADFGNHGNSTAYAMAWYEGVMTAPSTVAAQSITCSGTVTQSVVRVVTLQAASLSSSDSVTATDDGQQGFSVTSQDTVTATNSQSLNRLANIDLSVVSESYKITYTPPTQVDSASVSETSFIKIVQSDSVQWLIETPSISDINHPRQLDTSSTSESWSIVATTRYSDGVILSDYQQYPAGGSSAVIRDYEATLIMGPADVYVGDFGAPEPLGLGVQVAPPAAYWTHVGGLYKGVTITIANDWKEMEWKNISDTPARRLKKRRISAAMELAEPTLDNLFYAIDNGTLTSTTGYRVYTPPATVDRATPLTYKSVIIYGWAPGLHPDGTQKRRMIIMRKCLSTESIAIPYTKDEQTSIPITWAIHKVSETVAPFVIIDET